jgi:MoaA/NifB/PqqE/SkfB family radical SAM enzyme
MAGDETGGPPMYSPLRHIPSVLGKRRPIQLTFFVTRRCNARCPYCFYLRSDREAAGETETAAEELSLDEIRQVSSSLGRLLWVAFSGGEIYLRGDLVEISKVFYDRNRPSFLLYPTNGSLPELIAANMERILQHCDNSVIVVKLSLDGLNGAHDALRGLPGGFEKAMATHRLLAGLAERYPNFELGINTVFCSENQDSMDAIIDFVGGLPGVTTHTISLVRGDLADARYKEVDLDKYSRAIGRLESGLKNGTADIHRFTGARLKAGQDILQRRLILRTLNDGRRQIPCYAGGLSLVLTESGDVYPCEILAERFGNIRDHDCDMGKLLRSAKGRAVLESLSDNECFCTHECNFITNILFNPRLYPALVKECLQL